MEKKIDKEYIIKKLSEIDKEEYSILELGLFGSFSKEENSENSDIDVIVKMELKKGMYHKFYSLKSKLEEIFNRKVDLIDKSTFEYKFKNPNVRKYKKKVKKATLGSVIYV